MVDVVLLSSQLTALRAARASGARRVMTQTNGVRKEVEYRSDAEMAAAIADIERRLSAFSAPPIRTIRIATSKGFGA